jgi:hypothetical protein
MTKAMAYYRTSSATNVGEGKDSEQRQRAACMGVTVVLVENVTRFARDVTVAIVGHDKLKDLGITLVPVDAPDYFTDETPTSKMIRVILAAVAGWEKDQLVEKLRVARERKSAALGHECSGAKWMRAQEFVYPVEHVERAQELRGLGLSYRRVSDELRSVGMVGSCGPYQPSAIQRMVGR